MISRSGLRPIGILGAGGHAREVVSYCGREVSFFAVDSAFLDTDGTDECLVSVEHPPKHMLDSEVVLGVGAPALKRHLLRQWPGDRFPTVQADSSYLDRSASIARGTVLAPLTAIMAGVVLGSHVLINVAATVSHDSSVGDLSTISPGVHIGGGCSIGRGAFIGIGATIKDGIHIGDGAIVGAGAVVIADVLEREVVVGVPAKRLRVAEDWMRNF